MRSILLALAIVAIAELPNPPKAPACAPAPRRGESIDVNSEEAIVFYDAKTKTEHFIRRANFRTEAKDFGFLVPTPTKPELGETENYIFERLDTATLPRHVPSGNVKRIVQKRNLPTAAAGTAERAPSVPVILDRKKVAGYDAVVLQIDEDDGPAFLGEGANRLWLILGGVVGLGVLFLGVGFLIVIKKLPRGE